MMRFATAGRWVRALSRGSTALAAVIVGVVAGVAMTAVADPGAAGLIDRATLLLLAAHLVAASGIFVAAMLTSAQGRRLRAAGRRDAELAQLSWRLDFALAASEVGVWDVDLRTDRLMWDERARALFGVTERKDYYGEADWIAVIHPEDRARALADARAAVARDGRFFSDYRVRTPEGEVRHVRDIAAVYRGEDGAHRLVGLVWDVTPDVSRQQELELRRAEAEAATAAKSQFLAATSHEIRTPLGGVIGMLELMLADRLPGAQRERAQIARTSAESLMQILNDILDFSRLEARRLRVKLEPMQPRRVVREVTELMAAGAAHLSLTWRVADTVPEWLEADPIRLRQVLTNIVNNATKFTEAGEVQVRVGYSQDAGELRVEVEDTGIGIPPEMCDQIFDKFVQGDAGHRSGGAGLGLAICRQLVELMGGRIWVQSTPGVGSTFSFTLRAQPTAAPAVRSDGAEVLALDPGAPPMRVLLAEDNAANQYLIRAHLEAAGHSVTTVGNGARAVEAARSGRFDAVLMDVQMPEMDGPAAARAIRELPGAAGRLPIVALSASTSREDREACRAAGMDDYINKPVDAAALAAALRRAGDHDEREPAKRAG